MLDVNLSHVFLRASQSQTFFISAEDGYHNYNEKQYFNSNSMIVSCDQGFRCGGVEGEDVGELLTEALRAANLNVSVVALLNDTTGKYCFENYVSRFKS